METALAAEEGDTVQPNDPIFQKISQDPYAGSLGIELLDLTPGYSRLAMTVTAGMVNFHGIPHGGALFSLADAAFTAAANSHGTAAVAVTMTIHYMAAVPLGTRLIAEGREQRATTRMGFYQIQVTTEAGELVAACQAVVHRKSERFV